MFGPDDVAADPRIPWIFWSTEWPTPGTVSEPKSISDLKAKALTHALLHDLSWGQQGTVQIVWLLVYKFIYEVTTLWTLDVWKYIKQEG